MFKAREKEIKDIFLGEGSKFQIPRYQRDYSWDKTNIDEFWNDVISGSRSLPFIGTFVFNVNEEENKRNEVIDGQQRIVTITIFYSALRDVVREVGLDDFASNIQSKALATVDVRGRDQDYRVRGSDSMREFLEKNIQSNSETNWSDIEIETDEEKNIKKAYQRLRDKIENYISEAQNKEDKEEKLHELYSRVSELEVIEIRIDNDEMAYTVFETVNARGVDLSVADLLKNWIFQEVTPKEDGKDTAKERWQEMIDNLRSVDAKVSRFLRYQWASKYNHSSKKNLYRDIKKTITDRERFLDELLEASEWYRRMLSESEADWEIESLKRPRDIFRSLQGIKFMRVKQCYVLFLSLLRNHEELEFRIDYYFEVIEKFTYVYSAVSNRQANKVEKLYSETAIKIEETIEEGGSKKEIESALDKMVQSLQEFKPEYESFEEKFMEIEYKNSKKARRFVTYTLEKIDSLERSDEFRIDFVNVNIEHLLPKTYNEDLKIDKHTHEEYKNKLGNLVLFDKRKNSQAGNLPVEEKLDILSETEIPSTKKLISEIKKDDSHWGPEQIMNRQQELAEKAYNEVWNY